MGAMFERPVDEFLTDDQSFLQAIRSIAGLRSPDRKRKFPRFPTPAKLSNTLGGNGFDGKLIMEEADPSDGSNSKHQRSANNADAQHGVLGVNIVNFSEAGVELQFRCDDFNELKEKNLYLERHKLRVPMSLRWFEQGGSLSRGGFEFSTNIDTDPYLAKIILGLHMELIMFIMNVCTKDQDACSERLGVFLYLSIYYGLRLRLMVSIASAHDTYISDIHNIDGNMNAHSLLPISHEYSCTYNAEQIYMHKSNAYVINKLRIYISPFYTYGCAITGTHESIIVLKEEAWAVILNSVFVIKDDCEYSHTISPSLVFLYHSFLQCKKLFRGLLEEREFDSQFRYYSSIINRVSFPTSEKPDPRLRGDKITVTVI